MGASKCSLCDGKARVNYTLEWKKTMVDLDVDFLDEDVSRVMVVNLCGKHLDVFEKKVGISKSTSMKLPSGNLLVKFNKDLWFPLFHEFILSLIDGDMKMGEKK